ncbi:putative late blight resistance protein homolog R1A-3 [Nicotiana tabacum]|uniref:Late blight resistance protein homolog R1A-3 n=3 Tax=Nicotiana TaxID=4085 RepID=A0AC58U6V8_TOBAC|nr:PREDICTED: putative late blight resistance protein homolog R1B-16 [Nicotiana sylvestris]XP_009796564.1 PREDICTED: putative late blight resistance protein homolog R1B-16 [Nicotiana sylvestris]
MMDRGKEIEGEREKGEEFNFEVSFSTLRKDIFNVLDFIERLKNDEHQKSLDLNLIEMLKLELAFVCTYVQLSYSDLEEFEEVMTRKGQDVEDLLRRILNDVDDDVQFKYDMHHVLPRLKYNIYISSRRHSESSATMTKEHLHFLLLSLHHLSKYCSEQDFPLMTEYEMLKNVCGNISDFHGLMVNGCVEHDIVESVIPQFQPMAERVGHFHWNDRIDGDSRLFKLAHLLLKIIPIELEVMHICYTNLRASTSTEVGCFIKQLLETYPDILRGYLIHLQEHMVNIITANSSKAQNVHVMIEFLLIILTDVPEDSIHNGKLFEFLARVGALTRDVSGIARDLEEKSRNRESTNETNSATLGLLENIELLKRELKDVYLKAPDSSQLCFPMSDGPLFIHLQLRHLNGLLNSNAYSVALIKEEIKLVKEYLEFISYFLMNVEQELYKNLLAHALDVAYEAKDVIDSIILRDNGLLHLIFSLPFVIEKINLIKEEVSNLLERIPKNRGIIVMNSPKKPVEHKSSIAGKIIVGFKKETDLIIRNLTMGSKTLDVISITGMPGSGKTTLAHKVYNDKVVSSHFDIRAWCTVDHEYDEEELLESLFNQVTDSTLKSSENIDIADELRKQLFGKRYLIVLDDLWDIATWEELRRIFPEVEKGSRIILTTREKKVALHAQRHSDPLDLRLLRLEESMELLEKRVFGKESFPDDLLDVGKEIVRICKGLPLVVDLIAGVIAGKEKKRSVWVEVRNNLHSFIFQNEVDVMKVIALSYDLLPDPLKPCLLYLASYPKDKAILVESLKLLWPAEGFLEHREMESVEEVVEVYLDNLVSSSLVIYFNERKNCQIHDFVHDFCLIKAREEKLFEQIRSSSALSSSSSDLMPRQMTIYYNKGHFGHINFFLFDSKKKRHSGKHLYSLIINGQKLDNSLYDICHLRNLRLLRVLLLRASFIKVNDYLLNEICTLVHLRFLQIETEVKSLPLSFSNLWNLETLVVNNDGPTLVLLPTIWNLVKLRMVVIDDCSFFDLDTDEPILVAEDSKLERLRILGGLKLSYSIETVDIFKRFPNLQRLEFNLKESWDCSTEQFWFPKLDCLNELKFLKVNFKRSNTNDIVLSVTSRMWDFHFPSSLKGLFLLEFPFTSDSLSTIARLPNLEVLHLIVAIIEEEEWNMEEEDTFQKLKCLTLQQVSLAQWEVREESFPVLEKLRLWDCQKFKEIPQSFGDLVSLKIIDPWRSPQLEDSAREIKQYVEDMMGEDRIQVLVRQ